MKQEDKNLLLKDLCGRLPYGVKCSHPYGIGKLESIAKEEHGIDVTFETPDDNYYSIDDCKPYLLPLSSMSEEQKEELYIVTNGKFNVGYKCIDNCKPRNWSEWGTTEYNWIRHYDIDLLHTWLNANHFDYRGLIEKGLAIDATGLNIY